MRPFLIQTNKAFSQGHTRIVAWLLVFVCAWMGTGGVLHHTEAETSLPFRNHAASSWHQKSVSPPVDACAACEWTQGLTAKTSAVPQLSAPQFCLLSYTSSFSPRRALPVLRLHSSRAPPTSALF